MTPIILIPARMAATRLPGKPLLDIEGAPMIVRVMRCALAAGIVDHDAPGGPVSLFESGAAPDIATVVAPEASPADRSNPDVVKAVLSLDATGRRGRAHYFTRSTLYGDGPVWRHVGLYGYRPAALRAFNAAPPSPLEKRERLEQLRALELGLSLHAAVIDQAPISVDTAADLEAARAYARATS